jgi:hypothetical protein
MGMINGLLAVLFGGGRNAIKETVEVFRENSEAGAVRDADMRGAVMKQFAGEFARQRRGLFDRFMDALNRLPRPAMALGTLGLFVSAMYDPIWFASRMQGIALVPEPLWWLLGAIVSFYFGARAQAKGQEFQRSIAATMAMAPGVRNNIRDLEALNAGAGTVPDAPDAPDAPLSGGNPALDDWRQAS